MDTKLITLICTLSHNAHCLRVKILPTKVLLSLFVNFLTTLQ